jgi:hypothetical protein
MAALMPTFCRLAHGPTTFKNTLLKDKVFNLEKYQCCEVGAKGWS